MKFKPAFRVTVDGADITSVLVPRLISLNVSDGAGVQSDRLSLSLSDAEWFARLHAPSVAAKIRVWLGYGSSQQYMRLLSADPGEAAGPPGVGYVPGVAAPTGQTASGRLAITKPRSRPGPLESLRGARG